MMTMTLRERGMHCNTTKQVIAEKTDITVQIPQWRVFFKKKVSGETMSC